MPGLQEFIHKFEEGEGARAIRIAVILLMFLGLAVLYNLRAFKNFSAPEAMEAAQLARNLTEGRGYTTYDIRPLSMHLVQKHRSDHSALLKEGHPDLSTPPLYPLILAGLMKVAPFNYNIPDSNQYGRYQPELIITIFNQFWFFVAVLLVYFLARRLFDASVAWLAAFLLAFTDLFWRFSSSGLSTMLIIVIFLGTVYCLVRLSQGLQEQNHGLSWYIAWAAAAGILTGLGMLTRYSFGVVIVPVVAFTALYCGARRRSLIITAILAFGLVVSPWLVRNFRLSGTFLGTSGYAVYQETLLFSGTTLERSLQPDPTPFKVFGVSDVLRKVAYNGAQIFQSDLPRLGGNWIAAFFLVGLLLPFNNPTISRLRVFFLISLACLAVAQASSRTHLSMAGTDITSENLLVIAAPLVFIFGAALYHVLLDQVNVPYPELRRWVTALVAMIASLPLLLTLMHRTIPVSYPPYFPWLIQRIGAFMRPDELIMTDMPWAVAWYGHRQSVWLTLSPNTLNPDSDFNEIYINQKPVHGVYLTQVSLDSRFISQFIKGEYRDWGIFCLQSTAGEKGTIPPAFPLRFLWKDLMPNEVFISDSERWKTANP